MICNITDTTSQKERTTHSGIVVADAPNKDAETATRNGGIGVEADAGAVAGMVRKGAGARPCQLGNRISNPLIDDKYRIAAGLGIVKVHNNLQAGIRPVKPEDALNVIGIVEARRRAGGGGQNSKCFITVDTDGVLLQALSVRALVNLAPAQQNGSNMRSIRCNVGFLSSS